MDAVKSTAIMRMYAVSIKSAPNPYFLSFVDECSLRTTDVRVLPVTYTNMSQQLVWIYGVARHVHCLICKRSKPVHSFADRVARQADTEIELVERHVVGLVGDSLDNVRRRLVELVVGCLSNSRVISLLLLSSSSLFFFFR